MELYERLEQILTALRPVFRREACFRWFVLLVWGVLLSTQPPAVTSCLNVYRIGGHRVYVGDRIKVAKEGRNMPGVKGLHQESEDVSKPDWIRGHSFNALSLLLGTGTACFAVPLMLKVHDGLTAGDSELTPTSTLGTKMADICTAYAQVGSYIVLDAYFACEPVITRFCRHRVQAMPQTATKKFQICV